MAETTSSPYESVPYDGFALAQAHPDRLAMLARLFGLRPPEVTDCRVLEIGCGDGAHLLSVALSLPAAQCVGIDLAAVGIQKGRRQAEQLELDNVTLLERDIMDLEEGFGRFDFIIAHGFYAWVPRPVQDKLLAIVRAHLAEQGIAYVSYNVYPGCHLRDMVRGMMRFHVKDTPDARRQVEQARELMQLLAAAQKKGGLFGRILEKELERLAVYSDAHVFHDDLADCNAPVYFHEFVEHAARYGLRYLCEAHLFEMQTGIFPADVAEVLRQIPDRIAREQYLDFLKCRPFRQTLLCHDAVLPDETPRPERIAELYIAAPLRPETADPDVRGDRQITFVGTKGSSLRAGAPLIKAALLELGDAWPQAIHFHALLGAARERSGRSARGDGGGEDARTLAELLLRAHAGGIVELHTHPPRVASRATEYPLASPLARLQCQESQRITNLRHKTITLERPFSGHLLRLLDGSRDRARLLDDLLPLVESVSAVPKDAQRHTDPLQIREMLALQLEADLEEIARNALLLE